MIGLVLFLMYMVFSNDSLNLGETVIAGLFIALVWMLGSEHTCWWKGDHYDGF